MQETRIDEAYLLEWEAELNKPEEETAERGGRQWHTADQVANKEEVVNSARERIQNFRTKIAEEAVAEGKAYVVSITLRPILMRVKTITTATTEGTETIQKSNCSYIYYKLGSLCPE